MYVKMVAMQHIYARPGIFEELQQATHTHTHKLFLCMEGEKRKKCKMARMHLGQMAKALNYACLRSVYVLRISE